VPPQHADGNPADQTFTSDELLFRRVPLSHIEEGELSLLAIRDGLKFEKDPPDCSSVLRSKYCLTFLDALHPDCARKDCSTTHAVFFLRVGELVKGVAITPPERVPTRRWDLYPHHNPHPTCYAHSTICSCEQSTQGVPVKPPPSVRDEFRRWLRDNLQPCENLQ
jgi:hypothetical protein